MDKVSAFIHYIAIAPSGYSFAQVGMYVVEGFVRICYRFTVVYRSIEIIYRNTDSNAP
ncbi:hypothetical protein [Paenibacillus sp. GXUN7292]|uniref:hypothetical protein n=1 Tax=Paenibacillus sp. GXUN7292 TaxID=3422499 RepID=UPI003D7EC0CD